MSIGYNGVKRLAKERPNWLPIVEECLKCAKEYGKFAGSWVLNGVKKKGIKWFPGLRTLSAYGILKHTETTRSGRRAYYVMSDPEGVEKVLKELGMSNIKRCQNVERNRR
jgi:hypothetical protein